MGDDAVTPNAVVIATYNEIATIGRLLEQLSEFHVFVVDDSSPDGTGEVAQAFDFVTLIRRPRKLEVASAYLVGLDLARTTDVPYVIQMDAGGTHEPRDIGALVNTAEQTGADLVIGSRFTRWVWLGRRTAISRGAALLMRLLGTHVRDATSGFRCWRTDFLRQLDFNAVRSRGFAFQLELLYQATALDGRIVEVPIPYRLTNSSFHSGMLWEALRIYGSLFRTRWGSL